MWQRWRHNIRLTPTAALALLAVLTYVLIAAPRHIEAAGQHAAAICSSTGAMPAAPADLPDHDSTECCTLGCTSAGVRLIPAADIALVAPRAGRIRAAAYGAADITPPDTATGREHARPRAPPAAASRV